MRFNGPQFNSDDAQYNDPGTIYYDPYPPVTSNAWLQEQIETDATWTEEAQPSTP